MNQQIKWLAAVSVFAALQSCNPQNNDKTMVAAATGTGEMDRSVLPIAEPMRQTYTELDARNAKAPARFDVRAPKGAPNVVVVLIDDIGFGASHAFGGPINMPTLDRLAETGLKYN